MNRVLDTQKRHLILIGKFQQLCIEFAERKTLEDLEKSHTFIIKGNGFTVDRDIKGSRNILLKHLTR